MSETYPLPMPEPEGPAFEPCYFVPTDRLAELYDAEQRLQAVRAVVQEWESAEVRHEVAPIMRAASARIRRALDGDA